MTQEHGNEPRVMLQALGVYCSVKTVLHAVGYFDTFPPKAFLDLDCSSSLSTCSSLSFLCSLIFRVPHPIINLQLNAKPDRMHELYIFTAKQRPFGPRIIPEEDGAT